MGTTTTTTRSRRSEGRPTTIKLTKAAYPHTTRPTTTITTRQAGRTCRKKVAHAYAHDRPTTTLNALPVATKIYRRLLERVSFLVHGPITRRCPLIAPRQSFPKVVFPYTLQAYSKFLARVSILSRGSGPDECNGIQYTTVLYRALPLLKCIFCCKGRAASMPCKRLFITAGPVGCVASVVSSLLKAIRHRLCCASFLLY
jgi:hypothetical protein